MAFHVLCFVLLILLVLLITCTFFSHFKYFVVFCCSCSIPSKYRIHISNKFSLQLFPNASNVVALKRVSLILCNYLYVTLKNLYFMKITTLLMPYTYIQREREFVNIQRFCILSICYVLSIVVHV